MKQTCPEDGRGGVEVEKSCQLSEVEGRELFCCSDAGERLRTKATGTLFAP